MIYKSSHLTTVTLGSACSQNNNNHVTRAAKIEIINFKLHSQKSFPNLLDQMSREIAKSSEYYKRLTETSPSRFLEGCCCTGQMLPQKRHNSWVLQDGPIWWKGPGICLPARAGGMSRNNESSLVPWTTPNAACRACMLDEHNRKWQKCPTVLHSGPSAASEHSSKNTSPRRTCCNNLNRRCLRHEAPRTPGDVPWLPPTLQVCWGGPQSCIPTLTQMQRKLKQFNILAILKLSSTVLDMKYSTRVFSIYEFWSYLSASEIYYFCVIKLKVK